MTQTQEAKEKQEEQLTEGETKLQAQIDAISKETAEVKAQNEALIAEKEAAAEEAKAAKEATLKDEADIQKLFAEGQEGTKKTSGEEDLSQSELLSVIADALEKSLGANAEQAKLDIEKAVKASDTKIDKIATILQGMVAKMSVDATASKHDDFEEVRPTMKKVYAKYPGIEPEDAYYMAKSWMAGDTPPATKTASERPRSHMTASETLHEAIAARSDESMRPQGRARSKGQRDEQQREKPSSKGVVQAREIIAAGVSKVIDARMKE